MVDSPYHTRETAPIGGHTCLTANTAVKHHPSWKSQNHSNRTVEGGPKWVEVGNWDSQEWSKWEREKQCCGLRACWWWQQGREREVSGTFSDHFSDQKGTGWTVGGTFSTLQFNSFACAVWFFCILRQKHYRESIPARFELCKFRRKATRELTDCLTVTQIMWQCDTDDFSVIMQLPTVTQPVCLCSIIFLHFRREIAYWE